ncbi:hypothetical protein [Micromonospora sp. NPDC004704]
MSGRAAEPAPGRTTADILLDLLDRAASAHAEYEAKELGGVRDEQWAKWYAEHMSRALAENGYRLVGPTT